MSNAYERVDYAVLIDVTSAIFYNNLHVGYLIKFYRLKSYKKGTDFAEPLVILLRTRVFVLFLN